jgi:hypothetical protein
VVGCCAVTPGVRGFGCGAGLAGLAGSCAAIALTKRNGNATAIGLVI